MKCAAYLRKKLFCETMLKSDDYSIFKYKASPCSTLKTAFYMVNHQMGY